MKWKLLISVMLALISIDETAAMTNIVVDAGDLVTRIETTVNTMPQQWRNLGEGTTYSDPAGNEVTSFLNNVWAPLYNSQFETAASNALALDYRLVAFTDNTDNNLYYILERLPGSNANNYWGTYVFNPSPTRGQLIIQSPHPKFDTNTGIEGAHVFRQIGAAFFFMSGTHRCSSPVASGCDGFSSVCSNSIGGVAAPAEFSNVGNVFREGDVAHNEASMFQYVTEWVQDANPGYYYFIQLHGFSQDLDPHVILSNGRDEGTTPPMDDRLSILRTQLITQWDNLANSQISLDIEVAHDDPDNNFNSLLGTTNTQGRYINGSNDPCGVAANTNTGNFIHIEMAKKDGDFLLREEVNFDILGVALINTFLGAPLPVDLISFSAHNIDEGIELHWQTASEVNNSYFEIQRSFTGLDDFTVLDLVPGKGNSESLINYKWTDESRIYLDYHRVYYRLKQVDFNGQFELSQIITVVPTPLDERKQKLLLDNRGNGQNLEVQLPSAMENEDKIMMHITHTGTGTQRNFLVKADWVQDRLRAFFHKSPPGVYQVRLSAGGHSIADKFLRL